MNADCLCGSGNSYIDCCGRYLALHAQPSTAEALMRSRYTAYATANIDYIERTMQGKAAINFDPMSAKAFAEQAQWRGLTIKSTQKGQAEDSEGKVIFIARYSLQGRMQFIYESSEFKQIDGYWFYTDGTLLGNTPGRNELCWCGSGNKYKKCCQT